MNESKTKNLKRKRKTKKNLAVFRKSNYINTLHKKWRFPLRISSVNVTKILRKLQIWSLLLKKSLMENFIFCAVITVSFNLYKKIRYYLAWITLWAVYVKLREVMSILQSKSRQKKRRESCKYFLTWGMRRRVF